MIFEYKAQPNDRWMVVQPWLIYDHDFKNISFVVKVHTDERSFLVRSWKHFQAVKETMNMADYSKAVAEDGEVDNDAINPSHYKQLLIVTDTHGNYVDTLQWLEHLQYKPFWRNNMRAFVQATMDMCCDKYLARMGMKDDDLQEMEKSLWYHNFATAIMKNGYKPVRVNDVSAILNGPVSYFVVDDNDHLVSLPDGMLFTTDKKVAEEACATAQHFILSSIRV